MARQNIATLLALLVGGLLLLAFAISLAVSVGEIPIPLATAAKAVANRLFGTGFEISRIDQGIVWDYRLSRALVAASAGVALALSGTVLQALLRNPLAEPYVLGISAGASNIVVRLIVEVRLRVSVKSASALRRLQVHNTREMLRTTFSRPSRGLQLLSFLLLLHLLCPFVSSRQRKRSDGMAGTRH